MPTQKGYILILFIGAVLLVSLILGGYFWWLVRPRQMSGLNESSPLLKGTGLSPSPTPFSGVSDWKTYTNEKYGYEIKYPGNWRVGTMSSGANLNVTSTVNFQEIQEQTPTAESGFILAVANNEGSTISQICRKFGPYSGGSSYEGFLCGKEVKTSSIYIDGIAWEILDENSVGYVPSGQVIYDTVHNNKLFFIVDFSGLKGSVNLNKILSTLKFLD